MESIQLKTCSKCKIQKPLSSFSRHKGKPDGLRYSCKDCEKIPAAIWRKTNSDYQKTYYLKNREQVLKRMKIRREKFPEIHKAVSKRYAKKNKEKLALRSSQWVKQNPEKNRAKRARRRALEIGSSFSKITKKEISNLYNQACVYCGSRARIEIDHVVPLSRGGSHSIGNLVAACRYCNRSKGDKTIMEWRLSQIGCNNGANLLAIRGH